MDITYVLRRLAVELDKNRFYGSEATGKQITAVRIYLQRFVGRDDQARYRLMQRLFALKDTPETSKQLTKGQASALIAISRHEDYGPVLEDHINNVERG